MNHDRITDLIRRNPHIIGIENVVLTTGEAIIFNGEKYVTSPDNLIFTPSQIYVI